jgi:hypothetical protein
MSKINKREILYLFFSQYQKETRVKVNRLHQLQDRYKNQVSTSKLLEYARRKKIIFGPSIFCNSGVEVDLLKNVKDPYRLYLKLRHDPSVTSLVTFFGEHSLLVFRVGASILEYAESIIPTYPSRFRINHLHLTEKGRLPSDCYPSNWDDLDWDIYNLMRNPNNSFPKIAGNLNVTWKTVRNRFYELLKDCKVWIEFYPKGKSAYSQVFLTFKTEYEIGLRNELQKLNRTSILHKAGNTILLTLYLNNNLELYSFLKLEKKGLIHDLEVSIPVRHWKKVRRVGPKENHPRYQVDRLLREFQKASL